MMLSSRKQQLLEQLQAIRATNGMNPSTHLTNGRKDIARGHLMQRLKDFRRNTVRPSERLCSVFHFLRTGEKKADSDCLAATKHMMRQGNMVRRTTRRLRKKRSARGSRFSSYGRRSTKVMSGKDNSKRTTHREEIAHDKPWWGEWKERNPADFKTSWRDIPETKHPKRWRSVRQLVSDLKTEEELSAEALIIWRKLLDAFEMDGTEDGGALEVFRRIDTNESGNIDCEELTSAVKDMLGLEVKEAVIKTIMKIYLNDGNLHVTDLIGKRQASYWAPSAMTSNPHRTNLEPLQCAAL